MWLCAVSLVIFMSGKVGSCVKPLRIFSQLKSEGGLPSSPRAPPACPLTLNVLLTEFELLIYLFLAPRGCGPRPSQPPSVWKLPYIYLSFSYFQCHPVLHSLEMENYNFFHGNANVVQYSCAHRASESTQEQTLIIVLVD